MQWARAKVRAYRQSVRKCIRVEWASVWALDSARQLVCRSHEWVLAYRPLVGTFERVQLAHVSVVRLAHQLGVESGSWLHQSVPKCIQAAWANESALQSGSEWGAWWVHEYRRWADKCSRAQWAVESVHVWVAASANGSATE